MTLHTIHELSLKYFLSYEKMLFLYWLYVGETKLALDYYNRIKPDLKQLVERKLLKALPTSTTIEPNKLEIASIFSLIPETNITNSKISEVHTWIDEYRALFQGKKTKAMGNRQSCIDKMKWFFQKYPEYASKELVLKAAQRHIEHERRSSNYKFLRQADYFIRKIEEKNGERVESCDLAIFCEEVVKIRPTKSDERYGETFIGL